MYIENIEKVVLKSVWEVVEEVKGIRVVKNVVSLVKVKKMI